MFITICIKSINLLILERGKTSSFKKLSHLESLKKKKIIFFILKISKKLFIVTFLIATFAWNYIYFLFSFFFMDFLESKSF